jgi:hypothetical protein
MSQISKKKMIKVLKGEFDQPTMSKQTLLDQLAKPVTQEEWLEGYKRWKKQMKEHNVNN